MTCSFSVDFTCAKEVMFSSALVTLFVCMQHYAQLLNQFFAKFGGKLGYGPRMKALDFGGPNPNHVTKGSRVTVTVRWGHHHTPHGGYVLPWHFATSTALAELCALLNVILVL